MLKLNLNRSLNKNSDLLDISSHIREISSEVEKIYLPPPTYFKL